MKAPAANNRRQSLVTPIDWKLLYNATDPKLAEPVANPW